jgi:hypothetical protein
MARLKGIEYGVYSSSKRALLGFSLTRKLRADKS